MTLRALVFSAMMLILPGLCFAAPSRVTTQDGNVITGEVTIKDDIYTIITPYGTVTIPKGAVKSVEPVVEGGQPPQPGQENGPALHGGQPSGTGTGPLRFAGSNTIGEELMPALLEAYAASLGAKESDWSWLQETADDLSFQAKLPNGGTFAAHLSRHGSATAFEALLNGNADIGMASRQVKPEEADKLQGAGFGHAFSPGQENVLALDGLVVLVNKNNPVTSLSLSQIADLFSGKITNWSDLGGPSVPVHVYARDKNSGTYDTFNTLVLAPTKQTLVGSAQRFESSSELSDKVASDPGGIGFTGFAYIRDTKALSIVTECGLIFPPSEFFVETEEYPLARRLFLYIPANPTNSATPNFVDFALGPGGQEQAGKKGFISLSPATSTSAYGGNRIGIAVALFPYNQRLVEFARLAVNAVRASVTFRFQTGSSALDSRAVRDIDRLADYLKSPAAAGRKVYVIGFSDSRGADYINLRLSEDRAAQIAELLRQKGVNIEQIKGFGKAAPVACNPPSGDQEKNRRVEVWLY
ncbi:MAG: phosphate ABC transporter substrate-binding/OmpA family protein [Methylobacteriaceae bacterium]|nr:phosphate ABC transporter substrate-binding/OmpA family protein [Methylobacteriaceae bacterium]